MALTTGTGLMAYPSTSRGIRLPMTFAPTVGRWRVHVRNINPRLGTNNPGAVTLTGLWFGAHDGFGGFAGDLTQIVGAVSTGSDGSEYVSPWVNDPIGGGSAYLLAYGFTSEAATQSVLGGGWHTTSAADATDNAVTTTPTTTSPLDVWLEAEVPSTVPVIAAVGDSLSCGVGSTLPVHDSTVSQYARVNAALPVHYAWSGDAASVSTNATHYKWTRWAHLGRPDAVLVGMGSNDIFGVGSSFAVLQADYTAMLGIVTRSVSANIFAATVMPRDAVTGAREDIRRSFNAWLKSKAGPDVRDVFDFVPGVSADEDTLTPALTSDGTHLTTAGYAANVAAITRPLMPNPIGLGSRPLG